METSRQQTAHNQDKVIRQLEALPDKPRTLFTSFEENIIRKYYPTKGAAQIAKILGKTYAQIKGKASRMGLNRT